MHRTFGRHLAADPGRDALRVWHDPSTDTWSAFVRGRFMTAVAAQALMAEPKFYVRLARKAAFALQRVRGRDLRGKLLAVVRQYDAEVRPLPWHLEEVGHLWDAGCSNDTRDLSFGHQTSDFVGALRRAELEARTDHAARSALPRDFRP